MIIKLFLLLTIIIAAAWDAANQHIVLRVYVDSED